MKERKNIKDVEEVRKVKKIENKMKYVIEGKIKDINKILKEEFELKAYAVRNGKVLGVGIPNRKGEFKIEFEHPSETTVGVRVIIAPDIPEKYYPNIAGKNICMETSEHYVSATEWEEGSLYKRLEAISIGHLIPHWRLWMRPFHVHGRVVFKGTWQGVPYAIVHAIEVDPLPGGGYHQDVIGSDIANSCGNFHITFPWFVVLIPQARPDLIFRVFENIDGNIKVIYEEDPSKTRWNMVDNTWVILEVEEECTWFNTPDVDQPGDCTFLFTRIGLICVDRIDSNGYAESSKLLPPGIGDQPFGVRHGTRRLDICGWFGESSDVTHYKIQYCKDGSTFKDINDPMSNKYYDLVNHKWVTISMGPVELAGVKNLYTTPYIVDRHKPWYLPDLLAQWDSRKAQGDGRYTLRIIGYKWNGTNLIPATCLNIDPNYGEIKLQIDNSSPKSVINSITHVKSRGQAKVVKPCDIITFGPGDELRINFEASDSNGHLKLYRLNAIYGHNCRVMPRPSGAVDNYSPTHINPTQKWYGGIYTVIYEANNYGTANGTCILGNMPTCAYQFRLGVRKRTTNGYGLIYHWVEDTMHITIKRPGP